MTTDKIQSTGMQYTVQSGDCLERICKKQGVSMNDILLWNPDIKNPNQIEKGQVINLSAPANSIFGGQPADSETLVNFTNSKAPEKTAATKDTQAVATPNQAQNTDTNSHLLSDYLETVQDKELRELRPDVKKHEGKKSAMYFAPEGESTIGWGHQLQNKPEFLTDIETKKDFTTEQKKQIDALIANKNLTKEQKLAQYNEMKKHKVAISRNEKQRLFKEAMKDPVKKQLYKNCLQENLRVAAQNTDIKTGKGGVSLDIANNLKLSDEQMELLLASDMKNAEKSVETYLGTTWTNLTTGQKQVVMDIQFNTGKFTNRTKYPKFKEHLINGDYDKAQGELDLIRDSNTKKVQMGLIARNYHRMLLMDEHGKISEEGKATILSSVNKYLTEKGKKTVETYEEAYKIMEPSL